jgi:hypothetical protein
VRLLALAEGAAAAVNMPVQTHGLPVVRPIGDKFQLLGTKDHFVERFVRLQHHVFLLVLVHDVGPFWLFLGHIGCQSASGVARFLIGGGIRLGGSVWKN